MMVDADAPIVSAPLIRAAFTLTSDEVVRSYQLHSRSQLWSRATLLSLAVTLSIVTVFAVAAIKDKRAVAFIAVMACLGGLAAPRLMIRWVLPRTARRIYGQQRSLQRPLVYTFSRDHLHVETENGAGVTPWVDFVRLREDEGTMLFYSSDALFQIVPKRILQTDDVRTVRGYYDEAKAATV